jgi:hypothetical protein
VHDGLQRNRAHRRQTFAYSESGDDILEFSRSTSALRPSITFDELVASFGHVVDM